MAHLSSCGARLAAAFLPALFLLSLPAPLLAAPPAGAHALTASPRFLRFVDDGAGGVRTASPKLILGIGGRTTRAVMDTGSTGVVTSLYDMFPDWRKQPDLAAAIGALLPAGSAGSGAIDTTKLDFTAMKRMTYSSSGRIEYGVYIDRAVTVSGGSDGGTARSIISRPVPVLVVVDEECTPKPRHCTPNHAPTSIGMIGMGYGRAKAGDQYGTRALNPFLNLARPSVVNGYVVTADGVKVGLDADDLTMNSTYLAALSPNSTLPGEWMSPQVAIRLAGRAPVTGSMLLDTGINSMLMTVPSATSAGLRVPVPDSTDSTLPAGTPIGISLSGGGGLPTGYSFDTSQTTGMAPASVTLVGNNGQAPDNKATFVNTGVRFLNGFNTVFDDTHGLVGFASHAAAGP